MRTFSFDTHNIQFFEADVIHLYDQWASPMVIVADGPYGVSGYVGDPHTHVGLGEWYEPHIAKWSELATPQTTLWFWNTEVGWATVHPVLDRYGWEYRACNVWNKGIAHIAGNSNTRSLRQLPVVTEVCVQYVKKPSFTVNNREASMQEWLRYEWERTGLPLNKTNEACGVKNAATRKYFTKDHLWYFPPPDAFEMIVEYANRYGRAEGRPYFSTNGQKPLTKIEWEKMRSKFYCPIGITNVWDEPPVNGQERIKRGGKAVHLNQKPIQLMELIISISSDEGDTVWEPFGGLCTAAIAAHNLKRSCFAAEIEHVVYRAAVERMVTHLGQPKLL